jgi:PAS domain
MLARMERFECSLALDDELPPCDPQISRMHRYWLDIRPAGRAIPGRADLDPAAIPRLLPTIRLYDVHRDPWRFRYRLVGTELVRMLGRDPTGSWYHDVAAATSATQSNDDLVFVGEGKGICYRRGFPLALAPNKDYVTAERILLPLARDGLTVDMVLGFTVYHTAPSILRRPAAAA